MSDVMMRLRDGIDTIMSTGIDAREASRDEWQSCIDTGVEAIIALVREAMLSDAAVDEAAKALWNVDDGERSVHDPTWDKAVEIGASAVDLYREMARAALAAAGITGAGQEGGEGDE